MVAHSEICEVSLFTAGIRNAGRVGYDLTLESRTERWDWKVEVDMQYWQGGGRRVVQRRGGKCVGVPSRQKLYISEAKGVITLLPSQAGSVDGDGNPTVADSPPVKCGNMGTVDILSNNR